MGTFPSVATLPVVILLVFHNLGDAGAEDELCPAEASVDLTNAKANGTGFLDESGYFFPTGKARFVNGAWRGCVCDLKPCMPLCPTDGISPENIYAAIPKVYSSDLTVDEEPGPGERFHVFVWAPCPPTSSYFLRPTRYETDEYYLLGNGSLFLPRFNESEQRMLDFKRFCLKRRANETALTPRVCSPEAQKNEFVRLKYIGALVGVPFLIATVVVYSVLPELRSIHGTTLKCYLCCLLVTYVALAVDRIPEADLSAGGPCLFLGFTIYFAFLASFFWLNVMCFDMWWRLGGFGSLRSSGGQSDRKKFIGYSMYAWGCAVILTAICIGMEFSPGIPDYFIRPGFRLKACWFNAKTSAALYFFGPAGLTIACNVCLFVSTSIKIIQQKNNMERQLNSGESRRHDQNKRWFILYVKLFVVMGMSWSTEIISWLWEGPTYLWLVTDMVNALQGFLIFVIFVCKKKIWKSLKKRYSKLRITRSGCTFISPSSDSPATTASMEDSSTRCKIAVFALEKTKNFPSGISATAVAESNVPNDSR